MSQLASKKGHYPWTAIYCTESYHYSIGIFICKKLILQHLVSEHSPELCGYSTMVNDMTEIKAMFDRMTLEMANFTMRQNQIEEQHENAIAALRESINTATTKEKGKGVTSSEAPGDIYTPSGTPMVWATTVSTGNPPMFQSPMGYQYGSRQYHTPTGGHYPQTSRGYGGPQFPMYPGQIPTTGQGGGGFVHPIPHSPVSHGSGSLSRLTKVDFPRFDGTNLRTWMYKVDQFFSYDDTPYAQKVRVAALHFDDIAIEWHLSYIKSRPNMLYPTWDEYVYALVDRFGGDYEDPMSEFKLVRQVGLVKEYQREFDRIMTRLSILPEHAISGFITGLKPEIGFTVKSHRPFTLPQAYQLAWLGTQSLNYMLK
ncbi:hypothetical protein KY285_012801 [Solanum tuberosum]|nr:hypothetical protein KY285_012801 [Solanum tuberosum]